MKEVPNANSGQCSKALPGIQSGGICVRETPCGGAGQRACCLGERTAGACDAGLRETNSPNAGQCSNSLPGIQSSSVCVAEGPPCGAKGQRACTIVEQAERGVAVCKPGLIEAGGCNGDCFNSSGTCIDPKERISEPTTNSRDHGAAGSMRGFADTHVHMFSHLAFGGASVVGKPFDPGGINVALRPDFATDDDVVSFKGTLMPRGACPEYLSDCGKWVLHGDHHMIDDPFGGANGDSPASNFGAPAFVSWPHWSSATHQQVYHKWLERSWRGGMRLMVMLAVNNELFCKSSKRQASADCNDAMSAIDAQIAAAKEFEAINARQPGGGWFRIVETSEEAESVIREGKLAVVLGIEVDSLFNCKVGNGCTKESVDADLDRYFELGVRHIYPTHNFDNEFGGASVWMDMLNVGNRVVTKEWFDVEPCENSDFVPTKRGVLELRWLFEIVAAWASHLISGPGNNPDDFEYPDYADRPSCNTKGLSPLGVHLIEGMMNRGMLIDIDHMSSHSIDDALTMAEKRPGYPLFAGHVLFGDLHKDAGGRNERMRTREQLERMRELGSLISVMTQNDMMSETTYQRPNGKSYVNSCVRSSRSFAQSYLYGIDVMEGPVAFGSDFNGVASHVGPRFGDDACFRKSWGEQWINEKAEDRKLKYPFALSGFGTFDRQVTGQRTFDFNTDGLAHVGLLPDLIADMRVVGVNDQELEPLMNSAEAYVIAWRKAESLSGKP